MRSANYVLRMHTTLQRRRKLHASLLAATLVFVLGGCNRVLMVGDSVTVGAASATQQRLNDRGWDATIDGRVGRTTDEALAVIRARRGDNNIFVVESGYNDAGDPNLYRQRMTAILDELANADLVVVVNLNESRWYYTSANATIRDLAASRPNVRIADWNAKVRATGGLVQSDGIHLTTAGANAMADLVGETTGYAPGAA